MSRHKKQSMSFDDAMELADSMDLPDGAFWAMSHELAGLNYGEGFDLIAEHESRPPPPVKNPSKLRKLSLNEGWLEKLKKRGHSVQSFSNIHYRVNGHVDWWPTTEKWWDQKTEKRGLGINNMLKHLGVKK